MFHRLRLAFSVALSLTFAGIAAAHPSVTNSLDVVVHADRIVLTAKISLPQVDIANPIRQESIAGGAVDAAMLKASIDAHAPYLLSHLVVMADETKLDGRLKHVTPPADAVTWQNFEQREAVYEIEYPATKARPTSVRVEQHCLKEYSRLGQPWVVTFVTRVRQADQNAPAEATTGEAAESLLTREEPVTFNCTWSDVKAPATSSAPAATTATPAPSPAPTIARAGTFHLARQYATHGLEHILTGYDHLLFVAALVLAATRLWDLLKVVTAFAVAHTLTLTLSVLDLVRLPSSIVEPVIAASIVFVAMQNVLLPKQSRGAARLVVAFAFGLFHGLGFAGGLLEAMEGMRATSLAVALIAFTLGVEAAHQVLIVPLYLLLKPLRRTPAGDETPLRMPMSLRLASLLISAAGLFYLVAALRGE